LTNNTRELKIFRNKLYVQFRKQPNIQLKKRLDIANKYLSRAINQDTKSVIRNEIKVNGLWYIKKKYCDKRHARVVCDTEALSDYFASISNEPHTQLMPQKPSSLNVISSFRFRPISESELVSVYKKLKNRLKTSSDSTGISPFMLARTILAPNVTGFGTRKLNL
jgi:hypothetical protein